MSRPIRPKPIQALLARLLHRSDYQRWAAPEGLDPNWDARTKMIAQLIPAGARVIEFGAGRRQLERCLDPSCAYVPADLVSRGPDTILCDLNRRPLPDFRDRHFDLAVFSGVLEYVADLRAVAHWLSQQVPACISSYACARSRPRSLARLRETLARTRHGWINTCSQAEFLDLFRTANFHCRWNGAFESQQIFIFQRAQPPPATPLQFHLPRAEPGGRSWQEQLTLAIKDLAAHIPAAEPFILVDEDHLRGELPHQRALPFLEKSGEYWGPPPDDAAAIAELERLRRAGARFLVVAWPAFWWLDYYSGWRAYLQAHFPRIFQNPSLLIYDLRPRP